MKQEHRLGILGGMGPQATQIFYQRILDRTEAKKDQDYLQAMILNDTQIPDRTAAILGGREEEVFARLLAGAKQLEACGCTALAMTCNTAHYFADRLQEQVNIPLIHMIRETCRELAGRGCRRVGILGTDGTVRTGIYQKECAAWGMECVAPGEETQKLVMSIIYDEIKQGQRGSAEKFAAIDRALREMACDAAILGCTELSVFRTNHGLPDFYVDAMDVLVEQSMLRCGKQPKEV